MEKQIVAERVKFKIIVMPCCSTQLCYINPRLPNYCSECGKRVNIKLEHPEAIFFEDDNALIKYRK